MQKQRHPNGYTPEQESILDIPTICKRLFKRGIQAHITHTPTAHDKGGNPTNHRAKINDIYYNHNGRVHHIDTSVKWHLLYIGDICGCDETTARNKADRFIKHVYKRIKKANA